EARPDRHRSRHGKFRLLSERAADHQPTPSLISRPAPAFPEFHFAAAAAATRCCLLPSPDSRRRTDGRVTSALPISISGFVRATLSARPNRARFLTPGSIFQPPARRRGSISIPPESNREDQAPATNRRSFAGGIRVRSDRATVAKSRSAIFEPPSLLWSDRALQASSCPDHFEIRLARDCPASPRRAARNRPEHRTAATRADPFCAAAGASGDA